MQVDKLFNEGQQFHQRGQLDLALDKYSRALKLLPKNSLARIFKAMVYHQTGKNQLAVVEAEQALADMGKPNIVVLVNYGVILKNANRLDEASRAYEKALEISPNLKSAKSNLGTIYMARGMFDQAEKIFSELSESMLDAAPWINLARISLLKNETEKTASYIKRAEDFDTSHADLFFLKTRMFLLDADYESAFPECLKGLNSSPASRELWVLLQTIDAEFYDLDSIEVLLNVLAKLKIESATVLSIAVDICRKNWIWGPLEKLEQMLENALLNHLDQIPTSSDVFTLLGANVSQTAHKSAATACWNSIKQRTSKLKFEKKFSNSKLKVGFLSSDFRGHAIGYLIAGLIENLPKSQVEWYAYSNIQAEESDAQERFRQSFDRFIGVAKLSDKELAEKIKKDQIDVLIDLNQMTAMTRSSVMAYRAAPVQIQWLGMPGTLGAGEDVDYVIVDPWVVDEKNADGFSECLFMWPRSYQPNDNVKPDLSFCVSRLEAGLPEKGVVFGVFNQFYKFSPSTFRLWGEILRSVPDSVLWLLAPKTNEHKEIIFKHAKSEGIDSQRIIFAQAKPQPEHLARLQWMDLVLDTWPYNAHTTCSDALRAGVPVLTFPQSTFASRVAAGILETAGFDEWIANSDNEYVQKAIAYAIQPRIHLEATKANIKTKYWQSRMVDNKWLGQIFEAMVLHLHERSRLGKQPTSLKLNQKLEIEPLLYGRQAESTELLIEDSKDISSLPILRNDYIAPLVNDVSTVQAPELIGHPHWVKKLSLHSKKSRLENVVIFKQQVLRMSSIPLIIDVGASAINEKIGYEEIVDSKMAHVLGFEPDHESFIKLEQTDSRSYLQTAIGDGSKHTFNLCVSSGMNSILEPDIRWLALFPGFSKWGIVNQQISVDTLRLDEIEEAQKARFLKLDVQGAEMMILQNGERLLEELVLIQLEASPTPLYHGEATLFEIGLWLQQRGFVLHALSDVNKRYLKPFGTDDSPFSGKHQVFQVDAVFMPNPLNWQSLSSERLEALAFLSHAIYRSYDVAMLAMETLDKRDNGERVEDYRLYLDQAGLDA
jgi:FkbM family methyltransferase